MYKIRVLTCFTLLFLSAALQALPDNRAVHYILHYPPYWNVTEQGVSGFHYDMSKAIYEKAGLDVSFVVMPYARIEAIKAEERTQIISFGSAVPDSDTLGFPIPATIISLYSYSLKPNPPDTLAEYVYQRIAVKRGFPLAHFGEIINSKSYDTVELGTVDAAIQLLLYDRVDYVVTLQDPFNTAVKKYTPLAKPIYATKLSRIYGHPIAVNKNNKYATELMNRISQAYKELEKEGVVIHKSEQTLLTSDYNATFQE